MTACSASCTKVVPTAFWDLFGLRVPLLCLYIILVASVQCSARLFLSAHPDTLQTLYQSIMLHILTTFPCAAQHSERVFEGRPGKTAGSSPRDIWDMFSSPEGGACQPLRRDGCCSLDIMQNYYITASMSEPDTTSASQPTLERHFCEISNPQRFLKPRVILEQNSCQQLLTCIDWQANTPSSSATWTATRSILRDRRKLTLPRWSEGFRCYNHTHFDGERKAEDKKFISL